MEDGVPGVQTNGWLQGSCDKTQGSRLQLFEAIRSHDSILEFHIHAYVQIQNPVAEEVSASVGRALQHHGICSDSSSSPGKYPTAISSGDHMGGKNIRTVLKSDLS